MESRLVSHSTLNHKIKITRKQNGTTKRNGFQLMVFTSQKNSLPRSPQNHEIHDTSSELLILICWRVT